MKSTMKYAFRCAFFALVLFTVGFAPGFVGICSAQSVARQWNDALLDAIRIDFPAPTVHSRNLYHSSAAMYDAWSAFDANGQGCFYTQKHTATNVSSARDEAVSYAAYRLLSQRYSLAVDPVASQSIFDTTMSSLGYDPNITTTVGNSPAAIGNRIATQILSQSLDDGANEANGYIDNTNYISVNEPMTVDHPDVLPPFSAPLTDPNRWQPLYIDSALLQNGLLGTDLQTFVGPHWGGVTPFAMQSSSGPHSWSDIDPGPVPLLNGVGDQEYRDDTHLVIQYSNSLDPSQGPGAQVINASPSVIGNRQLGTHNDQGYSVNPVTGQPYADNFMKTADYGRVLAEFWADGPDSETPPGHWNVLANEVSDNPLTQKRIGGTGPVVDDLQWDVKMYLALNGAVHDSAIAAWGAKAVYDYVRPITKIRYQGSLGQSSDSNLPSYHPDGLQLKTGEIELITAASIAPGGVHRNVYDNANQDGDGNFAFLFGELDLVGKVAVKAWNHEPSDPETETSGTDWMLAQNWVPYQNDNFVTPAFAAYVSGHSTFSRAAAEVMAKFTGSEYFPGGLGEATFDPSYLEFEVGPSEEITLQWATYFDAADEAGISRLWGGIHVPVDDFAGRVMGSSIGLDAYQAALKYFTGNGDFDDNGVYDCADIDALLVEIAAANDSLTFDLTGDGIVDAADRQAWLAEAGGYNIGPGAEYFIGDVNLDGGVDSTDLGLLLNNFGDATSLDWCGGNLNGDSNVDSTDLGLLLNNFGNVSLATVVSVPEPSSVALLAFGVVGRGVRAATKAVGNAARRKKSECDGDSSGRFVSSSG